MVKERKPTVAIFGGSFDPPHMGHQAIVEEAVHSLDIDKLLVIPAYLNPFKDSSLAPAGLRLKWCHTLFGDIEKVEVDDYEIAQGKSTKTSQTVKHFKQQYDVKYLIIGADNLSTLTKWHEFEWLNEEIIWVIATRQGSHLKTQMLKKWQILKIDTPISSSHIRNTGQLKNVDKKIASSVEKLLQGQQFMTIEERIDNIVKLLDEKKAEEIEVFNLENADYIAKRVVIANSLNGKHTQALFDYLKIELKPKGETFLSSDISDEWAVIDLGDILIHIMIPEYRQRYSLETFLNELTTAAKKKQ
ncbi:MAG: nicotinate (nicotinamide) nucleotide adenylyltransferase [Campylobacterales bacterium]|nr:nicotinate (nicotinamide) nucleotide adenylyltransferase [Campylobacterales bacterium]